MLRAISHHLPRLRTSYVAAFASSASQIASARALLEVEPCASAAEVRASYYAKAQAAHPDHRPDDPAAAEEFAELAAAFELLKQLERAGPAADEDGGEGGFSAGFAGWEAARRISPLSIYLNVETTLERALAAEIAAAASMAQGGLDKGGMWEFARMVAADEVDRGDEGPGKKEPEQIEAPRRSARVRRRSPG